VSVFEVVSKTCMVLFNVGVGLSRLVIRVSAARRRRSSLAHSSVQSAPPSPGRVASRHAVWPKLFDDHDVKR
jgi:hypothetical protein